MNGARDICMRCAPARFASVLYGFALTTNTSGYPEILDRLQARFRLCSLAKPQRVFCARINFCRGASNHAGAAHGT